jgi:hypothetical protein
VAHQVARVSKRDVGVVDDVVEEACPHDQHDDQGREVNEM